MSALLGGLTPTDFLKTHWQKRPLVVRQALPNFAGILDRNELLALARRPEAIARVVVEHPRRRRGRWELHEGPFGDLASAKLPKTHWTLAVQGVENFIAGGWDLLRKFDFLPAARIDDLMVSYAAEHGSVGPHVDRYDVFLLQGPGRRRWQISRQKDLTVDREAPLKILTRFAPEEEFVLDPGDMLYLPPGVAHFGVATDGPCFTYSIGFVAPSHEALLQNFIAYLSQRIAPLIDPEALYEDPNLLPSTQPYELGGAMVSTVESLLQTIRWDHAAIEEFLGKLLTGPKPNVRFHPPVRALSERAFRQRLKGAGQLSLALPSRALHCKRQVFLNGEMYEVDASTLQTMKSLFSSRKLALPLATSDPLLALLHRLYRAGFLEFAR